MRAPKLPRLDLPTLDFGPTTSLALPDLGLVPRRPEPDPDPELVEDLDPVDAVVATMAEAETAFQSKDRVEKARITLATDSEYWVCVCFETREQKEEFLRRLKLIDLGDKHIDGLETARRLGVPLKSPRAAWNKRRGFTELAKMAAGPGGAEGSGDHGDRG